MANEEMIKVEGVSDLVPKLWGGQLAIYFCNYCEKAPVVGEGEVAVSVGHTICVREAGRKLNEFGAQLVRNSKVALIIAEIELQTLKDDIGRSNPN